MTKAFALINREGFADSVDEQASTDAFVDYIGGQDRVEHLAQLYRDSYPGTHTWWNRVAVSKDGVFRRKAREAGYKAHEVDAYLKIKSI